MASMKIKVKSINKPMFFVKEGAILIYDGDDERLYTEDREQWMPAYLAEENGLKFEVLW